LCFVVLILSHYFHSLFKVFLHQYDQNILGFVFVSMNIEKYAVSLIFSFHNGVACFFSILWQLSQLLTFSWVFLWFFLVSSLTALILFDNRVYFWCSRLRIRTLDPIANHDKIESLRFSVSVPCHVSVFKRIQLNLSCSRVYWSIWEHRKKKVERMLWQYFLNHTKIQK
jgi:hypothetical protein